MTAMSFKEAFFDEFSTFKTQWESCWNTRGAWWRVGNALHASLECIVAAQKKWGRPDTEETIGEVRQMLDQARSAFLTTYNDDGVWFDDFGWWGIAFLAVYEEFAIFDKHAGKTTAAECLQSASDCWQKMYDKAWDRGDSRYPIPIPGGCWNKKDAGAQNTVTNALFLTLSIRLYSATRDKKYLNAACDQFLWFGEWFLKGPNRDYGESNPGNDIGLFTWLEAQEPNAVWVLERATNGAKDGSLPPGNDGVFNGGDPDPGGLPKPFEDKRKQYWTGDQGIMIAGCIGMYEQRAAISSNPSMQTLDQDLRRTTIPSASDLALHLTNEIVCAAADRLFTIPDSKETNKKVVLHEGPLSPGFLKNYPTDYAVGKGVLLRYMAFAYAKTGQDGLKGFNCNRIVDTASSILSHAPNQANLWGLIWDDKTEKTDYNITLAGTNECDFYTDNDAPWQFSVHTARLDALTAAVPWADKIPVP